MSQLCPMIVPKLGKIYILGTISLIDMWPFAKQTNEVVPNRIHSVIAMAFHKVKQDTSLLFKWVSYFHQKHQEHDERIAEIERQIYYMPKTREEIKHIIDSHYSLDPIHSKIREIHERIQQLESEKKPAHISVSQIVDKPAESAAKSSFKEKLMKRIVKNSKEYIKSLIFATIRKYGEIPASKLKEIIVEEQGLCSKSSFYRLLAEIETENELGVIEKGKEKIYLMKSERYLNK